MAHSYGGVRWRNRDRFRFNGQKHYIGGGGGSTGTGGTSGGGGSTIPINALLDENGNPVLDENGNYILV